MLKIEQFIEQNFGIKLLPAQLEIIAMLAANPDIENLITPIGKRAGKTTAVKSALSYLQDGLTETGIKKGETIRLKNFGIADGSYKVLDVKDGSLTLEAQDE
ncbi:hypothetical protein [Polynucleobacter sp.]|uniref:hypothetical protein n=1 Tax=Polynucleobacter sp. TaxID=2029855 RepID=UPI003F699FCD